MANGYHGLACMIAPAGLRSSVRLGTFVQVSGSIDPTRLVEVEADCLLE